MSTPAGEPSDQRRGDEPVDQRRGDEPVDHAAGYGAAGHELDGDDRAADDEHATGAGGHYVVDEDTQVFGSMRGPEQEADPYQPPQIDPAELAGLQDAEGGAPAGVRRVLPLEDEASTLVARYMFPTERFRGEWKRHLIHLITPLVVGVAATVVLGWLAGYLARQDVPPTASILALLTWLAFMTYVGWQVADWHFDRFILTNKRVMVVNGIVTRNVAMMPLLRVTDMKYEQSPLGRVLNYGTFILESAGQDQALRAVPHLPNPNELYLRVVEEMYEPAAVEARMSRDGESEEERQVGDS